MRIRCLLADHFDEFDVDALREVSVGTDLGALLLQLGGKLSTKIT